LNQFETPLRNFYVSPVGFGAVFFKRMEHMNQSANLNKVHDPVSGARIVCLQFPNALAN
jgi:hypothetical protein